MPLSELCSLSLQIPFPSDLNTDLVVEKGGKTKFKLVSASLLVQPCSERGQLEDSLCWPCSFGKSEVEVKPPGQENEGMLGIESRGAVKICRLGFAWAGFDALIPSVQQPIDFRYLPVATFFSGITRLVEKTECLRASVPGGGIRFAFLRARIVGEAVTWST